MVKNLNFEFGDGIELNWTTGWIDGIPDWGFGSDVNSDVQVLQPLQHEEEEEEVEGLKQVARFSPLVRINTSIVFLYSMNKRRRTSWSTAAPYLLVLLHHLQRNSSSSSSSSARSGKQRNTRSATVADFFFQKFEIFFGTTQFRVNWARRMPLHRLSCWNW